ncbi:MAG: DNA-binding domain-containing protein [Burkholderiaceae bacterium]
MNLENAAAIASERDFAAALLDPTHAGPAGLRTWNGSDPARRVDVYRNNVISSLIDALADTYPMVQQLVGEEFFRAMASVFIRQHPPRTRILAHYGDEFAAFVGGFEPARAVPYLSDMARLEFARLQASHAADAPPIADAALAGALLDPERLAGLRLIWQPSMRRIESIYAVASLWAAHQTEGTVIPVSVDDAERALVLRDGLDVLVLPVDPGTTHFVALTSAGHAFGAAAAAACERQSGFDLGAALSLLLRHGALVALHDPISNESI